MCHYLCLTTNIRTITIMKKLILLFAAISFSLSFQNANAEKAEWKELNDFHSLMSKSFHPAEEGNFEPLKENASALAKSANAWAVSKIPDGYDKELTPKILAELVAKCEAIEKRELERRQQEEKQDAKGQGRQTNRAAASHRSCGSRGRRCGNAAVAEETPAREVARCVRRSARQSHATTKAFRFRMLIGAENVEVFSLRQRGCAENKVALRGEFGEGEFGLLDAPAWRRVERIVHFAEPHRSMAETERSGAGRLFHLPEKKA